MNGNTTASGGVSPFEALADAFTITAGGRTLPASGVSRMGAVAVVLPNEHAARRVLRGSLDGIDGTRQWL